MKTKLTTLCFTLVMLSTVFAASNPTTPAAPTKLKADILTVLLNKYDTSHNNKLDTKELATAKSIEPDVYADIIRFDLDKNNILDSTELNRWKEFKNSSGSTGGKSSGA